MNEYNRLDRSDSFSNPKHIVHRIDFKEGMQVAEFGAGSGAYVLALAELVGPRGMVYAVDVQRDLLNKIATEADERKLENVEIVWGDIEEVDGVKIADGTLDGVVIANTLFQTDEKNRVFKEAWRVLKKGGLCVVVEWSDSFNGIGPKKNDIVSQQAVSLIATDNGFALKHEFDAGKHHYGVVYRKVTEQPYMNDSSAAIGE